MKEYIIKGFAMYLDYAEMQAKNRVAMTMKDWENKLDAFLRFNGKNILNDLGKVSHEVASALAKAEWEKYSREQDRNYISDFDREMAKFLKDV